MKLAELFLAAATGLCGAGVTICALMDWERAGDILAGAGLVLCSAWLLMRSS